MSFRKFSNLTSLRLLAVSFIPIALITLYAVYYRTKRVQENTMASFNERITALEGKLVDVSKALDIPKSKTSESLDASVEVKPKVIQKEKEWNTEESLETVSSEGHHDLSKSVEDLFNALKSFHPFDFYKKLYAALDKMSMLEELALLNCMNFSTLLFTVFSIIGILLSEEILSYFNLKEKYPKLHEFFKLRASFQRYYL